MQELFDTFYEATGGHNEVQDSWIPVTAVRALLLEDPVLIWLEHHGKQWGLEKDSKEYSFLEHIAQKGHEFEAKWIREVLPDAVQLMNKDWHVRRVETFLRTMEELHRGTPAIVKAALWYKPQQLYGSTDILLKSEKLYELFPHLKPEKDEPNHYIIMDCKFSTGLHLPKKRKDYLLAATQVRTYSYILGHLQGFMPIRAFLVTRDRPHSLIAVEVDMVLDDPIDPEIARLRDWYLQIKHKGQRMLPWECSETRPNFSNEKDEPWHDAKRKIREEFMEEQPLELLPFVGNKQAEGLRALGFQTLDNLLKSCPDTVPFETVNGLAEKSARRIRTVLHSHRSGKAPHVPTSALPPRRTREFFIDYEFLNNMNVDIQREWHGLEGTPMVFMVGVGWEQEGEWQFRSFVAEAETHAAERKMLQRFMAFLEQHGALSGNAALYHWSHAEPVQTMQAVKRSGLTELENLPWCDLKTVFEEANIALPGAWGLGIKEVAKALGELSPTHSVEWPSELGDGLRAMVMAWDAYKHSDPINTEEMRCITAYLEVDCKALSRILAWLRDTVGSGEGVRSITSSFQGWFRMARARSALSCKSQ